VLKALAEQSWGRWNLIRLLRGDPAASERAQDSAAYGALRQSDERALGQLVDSLLNEGLLGKRELDHGGVVLELTSWRGADVVVDAVGHESALAACFPLVRMGGTISLAGMYTEVEGTIPIGDLWLKNITIVAGAANVQGHMDEVIELVRDGRLDPKVIISHRMPLSKAAEGYELFDRKEALKVVLDPTG
jgi:threonine dehydrogenase-like Zn-dependent dehydrogenase